MFNRKGRSIDIATELGESFALPVLGVGIDALRKIDVDGKRLHPRHTIERSDDTLLSMISTGYVACGAHSGDAIVMGRTIRDLVQRDIAIGAHPSYPDVFGFGQETAELSDVELEDVILSQLSVISAMAKRAGSKLVTVKCHGALSFDVAYDERTAQTMARAIYRFDPAISLVVMAASHGVNVARHCGIQVIQEAYIDRGYDRTGRLISRHAEGALITEPAAAVRQLLSIALDGYVTAIDGERVRMDADSFCLHSDTPNAQAIAAAVSTALREHGMPIRAAMRA